jgi:N,N'-diacetyllegionaminate synthase
MAEKVYIIAEAGVNHNGDVQTALKLVDVAAKAGVDAIKFQTYVTENLVTSKAKQADYQIVNLGNTDGQYAMLKKLELSFEDFHKLKKYCDSKKIQFLSTAFDNDSIDFLNNLGLEYWKIPSGEITNLPYLRRIGAFKQKVILSTGMASLGEVEAAINVIKTAGTCHNDISLLHCTTEYPAAIHEVNLKAMVNMGLAFNMEYGYSDHTKGIEIPIAAVAMGARIIEKHFTLDKNMPGPDHAASLEPLELSAMIRAIRNTTEALGDGIKRASPTEIKNREIARKCIVAKHQINIDEILTEENITVKRAGNGISPMYWDSVIGKLAKKTFLQDEIIEL